MKIQNFFSTLALCIIFGVIFALTIDGVTDVGSRIIILILCVTMVVIISVAIDKKVERDIKSIERRARKEGARGFVNSFSNDNKDVSTLSVTLYDKGKVYGSTSVYSIMHDHLDKKLEGWL